MSETYTIVIKLYLKLNEIKNNNNNKILFS